MADAIILQVIKAVIVDLNTNRPDDVPEVTSRRVFPNDKVTDIRMAVFLGDEDVDPPRGQSNRDRLTRRRTSFAVQCVAPTDLIEEIDEIVQPMLNWSSSVLGHNRLGGLVHYLRETGTTRRVTYQDMAVITATQIFECSYQTLRNDLTARL